MKNHKWLPSRFENHLMQIRQKQHRYPDNITNVELKSKIISGVKNKITQKGYN